MLTAKAVKIWYFAHQWSSLVCTVFLFVSCLTGLPLIFHDELAAAMSGEVSRSREARSATASLDAIVEAARTRHAGKVPYYVRRVSDGQFVVGMLDRPNAPLNPPAALVYVDAQTGKAVTRAKPTQVQQGGRDFMQVVTTLHEDLFLGTTGQLILGAVALLFVVSIVSGAVVYGPFMRNLAFGEVRRHMPSRVRWLDLHNLLGIVILVWTLVVGVTGVINAWADFAFAHYRKVELGSLVAPYMALPLPARLASLQQASDTARKLEPGLEFDYAWLPGHRLVGSHVNLLFMRHANNPSIKLHTEVLFDAGTGKVLGMRGTPWYIMICLLAQPLHFGDYGGMPLKVLWAVFDVATMVVLGSGIYLWLRRRRAVEEVPQ